MVICDVYYNFILVDIGDYGSNNDSGVLLYLWMVKVIEDGLINFLKFEYLEGCDFFFLFYFLVGDEVFGLKLWF